MLSDVTAGTPESGGWTSRELRRIIYALRGLNVVGFDVVELAPAYDTNGELRTIFLWLIFPECSETLWYDVADAPVQPRSLL